MASRIGSLGYALFDSAQGKEGREDMLRNLRNPSFPKLLRAEIVLIIVFIIDNLGFSMATEIEERSGMSLTEQWACALKKAAVLLHRLHGGHLWTKRS